MSKQQQTSAQQVSQQVAPEQQDYELPMLAGISAFFHWLEEFVVILSGPFLTLGLGIGLVDLLSDGALFLNAPALLYLWAIAQTVGVDGQLVGTWARARHGGAGHGGPFSGSSSWGYCWRMWASSRRWSSRISRPIT